MKHTLWTLFWMAAIGAAPAWAQSPAVGVKIDVKNLDVNQTRDKNALGKFQNVLLQQTKNLPPGPNGNTSAPGTENKSDKRSSSASPNTSRSLKNALQVGDTPAK